MASSDADLDVGPRALPSVNLLPPEIGRALRFRRVQRGLCGGVLGAVVLVGLLYVSAVHGVSHADQQLADADSQQRAVQSETARYGGVTATYTRVAAAQALLSSAMGQEVRYSRFLNDLSLSIPANVWVTNLAFSQTSAATTSTAGSAAAASSGVAGLGTVTISGIAYEHADVATWLESLTAEKGYAVVNLQSSTEALMGSKKVVNWSAAATLTQDALSGRYPRAGG